MKSVGDIESLLLEIIRRASVEDPGCLVEPSTIPMRGIKGFDSLTVLETLTEFEEETGLHFEDEIFYIDVKPRKHRSIRETASAIWAEIQKGAKKNA
jgi:acyl carrier protein